MFVIGAAWDGYITPYVSIVSFLMGGADGGSGRWWNPMAVMNYFSGGGMNWVIQSAVAFVASFVVIGTGLMGGSESPHVPPGSALDV